MKSKIISLLIFSLMLLSKSAPAEDIVNYDEFTNYPYKASTLYSGYLNISATKQLHYVLVESQTDKVNDPLVLWLNGGPGCSSLIGFINENGPAVTIDDNSKTLKINPFSWNKNANVLYLEAPAGVGFSTQSDKDYSTNDDITSSDNLLALQLFFKTKFPEYIKNRFYISGESYAGIYIPTLSAKILQYNDSTETNKINLQGVMIGNGIVDWRIESNSSLLEFLYTHSVISQTDFVKYTEICHKFAWSEFTLECDSIQEVIMSKFENELFLYDIYRKCYKNPITSGFKLKNNKRYRRTLWVYEKIFKNKFNSLKDDDNGCAFGVGTGEFLNNETTKKSLHVPNNIEWADCADVNYFIGDVGSFYVYPYLIEKGLKIWLYSGDTDSVVSLNGTQKWLEKLNLSVEKPWNKWKVAEEDTIISGFRIKYKENITFLTIRETGHMAPQWKPREVFHAFSKFLNNEDL